MKKTNTRIYYIALCVIGIFVCGCANNEVPVKVYSGPQRPNTETVLLKIEHETFITDVYGPAVRKIWDANNELIWQGISRLFRLMPGDCSFEVYYDNGNGCPNGAIQGAAAGFAHAIADQRTTSIIKTNFDSGKEYILKYKRTGLFVWDWKVKYWIEDSNTGQVTFGSKPEVKK